MQWNNAIPNDSVQRYLKRSKFECGTLVLLTLKCEIQRTPGAYIRCFEFQVIVARLAFIFSSVYHRGRIYMILIHSYAVVQRTCRRIIGNSVRKGREKEIAEQFFAPISVPIRKIFSFRSIFIRKFWFKYGTKLASFSRAYSYALLFAHTCVQI